MGPLFVVFIMWILLLVAIVVCGILAVKWKSGGLGALTFGLVCILFSLSLFILGIVDGAYTSGIGERGSLELVNKELPIVQENVVGKEVSVVQESELVQDANVIAE